VRGDDADTSTLGDDDAHPWALRDTHTVICHPAEHADADRQPGDASSNGYTHSN
jgi:hypothetical protein